MTTGYSKGDVVIVPFPFSDLSGSKRRPAVVVALGGGADVILCQITSQVVRDAFAVPISSRDFASGQISQVSNVRPNKIFTADSKLILYRAGRLKGATMQRITERVIRVIQ